MHRFFIQLILCVSKYFFFINIGYVLMVKMKNYEKSAKFKQT